MAAPAAEARRKAEAKVLSEPRRVRSAMKGGQAAPSISEVGGVGGKVAVERAVALAEQMRAGQAPPARTASLDEIRNDGGNGGAAGVAAAADPAAEARRLAAELLGASSSPPAEHLPAGGGSPSRRRTASPVGAKTPPRVPPAVAAAAVAAANSTPDRGAAAVAAKARAVALSMREDALFEARYPSPDRNTQRQRDPETVRITGLRRPAENMNGDYHPQRSKGTPANRSLAWKTHNGRAVFLGRKATIFWDGNATWKLGPEAGSNQCCCFA